MGKYKDVTGQRFTRLVAIEDVGTLGKKGGEHFWRCKCDCGNEVIVRISSLVSRNTQSCGCYGKEQRKNATQELFTKYGGLTSYVLYNKWCHIRARCTKKSDAGYKHYGARGTYVCDEWNQDFMAFYNWAMVHGWKEGLTIERLDNDGPYSPENCIWATMKVQCRNKRTSHKVTYKGLTMNIADWSILLGIEQSVLWWRLKQNWPVEHALFYKMHQRHKKEELNELQSQKKS